MIKEIQEQIAYYNARSQEYDEWFYRIGRYDRGLEQNQRWFNEVDVLKSALYDISKVNSILELACGTGIWTQELLHIGNEITAIDASAEMIVINKKKLNDTKIVDYQQVDLFSWQPTTQYDLVFFSFWLSHVPPTQVDDFLAKVYRAVLPYGKVFIIDSCFDATSTAKDHVFENKNAIYQRRKLNNGQEYHIYKIYYQPNILLDKLTQVGFQASVKQTNNYFIYAEGIKSVQLFVRLLEEVMRSHYFLFFINQACLKASACCCVVIIAFSGTLTPLRSVTPTTIARLPIVTLFPTCERNKIASSPIVKLSPTSNGP